MTGSTRTTRNTRSTRSYGKETLTMRRTLPASAAVFALLATVLVAVFAAPAQARPTDGANDPFAYGYAVPATSKCAKNVCVHWVTSTADAATTDFAKATLKAWQRSYKVQVKKMGFRKPLKDGKLGGNKKLDVYLKELGGGGQFGFCQAEERRKRFLAQSYCLADNDFANPAYGGLPATSLIQSTAAKTLFTAVQNAYDAEEDAWFADSTGTWMMSRVFKGGKYNQRYLHASQAAFPGIPLDTWVAGAEHQFGNWIWWEFLTKRYGKKIVPAIWKRAAADKKDDYSIKAVTGVLRSKRGFTRAYSEFAAWNTRPGRFYRGGKSWPTQAVSATTLSKSARTYVSPPVTLAHLSSASVEIKSSGLKKKSTTLRLKLKGPKRKKAPGAFLLVNKKKGLSKVYVKFNKRGKAKAKVPFSSRRVKSVTVTLVNASTRYACFRGTTYSCEGTPRDDGSVFTIKAKVGR